MQTKLKDLMASLPALARFNQSPDLPVRVSYLLIPISKRADEHVADFNQMRLKLLEAYKAAAEESAGDAERSKAATDTFNSKLQELLEVEVVIEGTRIPFAALPEDLKMSAQDLNMLSWLIELPSEKEPTDE